MSQKLFKVLVADDDPTVRLLMQAALAGGQFVVTVVEDGAAALSAFNRGGFDIVLLDVEMPVMDGFEVCAAIRHSHGAGVRLVLITGHDDPVFRQRASELGVGHIAKPVNWSGIAARIQAFLDGGLAG